MDLGVLLESPQGSQSSSRMRACTCAFLQSGSSSDQDRIAKTGKKPKAIVPVALYGMPYRADRIMEIANKYEIPVVEDAAEGFGSRYNGQVLGTFG